MYSPIALFVYTRLEHTKKTINALKENHLANKSDLIIFSDGEKNSQDIFKVREVRKYIYNIEGFNSIKIIERDKNYGLSKNIIEGINFIFSIYDRVIVLEDDLVTSPWFLTFMNDGLDFYQHNSNVVSIHGYVYNVDLRLQETFFIRGADCWGWSTWKESWKIFNPDAKFLLSELKKSKQIKEFNLDNNFNYSAGLEGVINGKNDSWAVRWHASAFLSNKLTLYPSTSLVKNIGFDGSGRHSGFTNSFDVSLSASKINIYTIDILESAQYRKAFIDFFIEYSKNDPSLFKRIFSLILPIRIKKALKKYLNPK